ncbi:hypothetical protein TNCV_4087531 [Trichonephila clavipes]|uniref:Uncharacterized protein n=1 Tax=Trichonephila clavipes TaxID=2585209 RepID=A0A8X6RCV7_TRICX|nr:hypothetical protein TNCV_4087531 [Trichonephila clavipes]
MAPSKPDNGDKGQIIANEKNQRSNGEEKKAEEKHESPIPAKKDVTPSAREIKKSSPESLYNNTVNLTTIEYNSEGKTSNVQN